MVRNGKAQTRPAHGVSASNIAQGQRKPPAFTTCERDDRTGSREPPLAWICVPRHRFSVSSLPMTTGPAGTNVWTPISGNSRTVAGPTTAPAGERDENSANAAPG